MYLEHCRQRSKAKKDCIRRKKNMNTLGKTIHFLRKSKGVTQEKMAEQIGVSFQTISKWENESTLPDIMMLPLLADYFGVSIDDLFQYKWNVMTSKERMIYFMMQNQILRLENGRCTPHMPLNYAINTEQFTTNTQLSAIGEAFAETLLDHHVEFDCLVGLAYHGIGFSIATALALQNKFGVTTHFCYDRKLPDRRGRILCGHTPEDGDRIVLVDDVLHSGEHMMDTIARLKEYADVEIAAILVIAETCHYSSGIRKLEETYGAPVFAILHDEDIQAVLRKKAFLP